MNDREEWWERIRDIRAARTMMMMMMMMIETKNYDNLNEYFINFSLLQLDLYKALFIDHYNICMWRCIHRSVYWLIEKYIYIS